MEELREIARFLDREVQKFSEKAYSDVKADAPRTTPALPSFEVWFGRSKYKAVVTNVMSFDSKMTHIDFLEAIMSTYLKDRTPVQVRGYEQRDGAEIAQLSWDGLSGVRGEHSPAQDVIWMQFLPYRVAEQLGNAISSNFNSQVGSALQSFPVDYSRRNYFGAGKASLEDFNATFAHELTHFYATTNTKLGELQRKGSGYYDKSIVELGPAEFAEYINTREQRKNRQNQASAVGHNDSISAIEEVFAHFIGFQYAERRKVSSSYERDKYIQWGLDILYEKASAENPMSPVDWAREEMGKVFNDIAQRGQIRSNDETRDVFIIFLRRIMPRADRKRMNYMRQIAEGDLSTAYRDLQQALQDAEEVERGLGDGQAFRDFKDFEQEVDWDNPREIEDIVLHQVLEEAVGNLSLSETEDLLKKELGKEIENLEKLVEKAKTLEGELADGEADQELVAAVKELLQAENEIKKLT